MLFLLQSAAKPVSIWLLHKPLFGAYFVNKAE